MAPRHPGKITRLFTAATFFFPAVAFLLQLTGCKLFMDMEEEDHLNGPLATLVSRLLPPGEEVPYPLAIGDFLLSGQPSDLGREIAASLPASITLCKPGSKVISHKNLQALLKAQKLQMKDLFLEQDGTGPGNLLPARTLLVGFLFPWEGEGTALQAQLIDVGSGRILNTAKTFFPDRRARLLDPYSQLPLEISFTVLARHGGDSEEYLVKSGDTLHSGDTLKVRLKPNREACVYCFLLDSQGRANLLFPRSPSSPLRVQAGELVLPSYDQAYRLDSHPGEECLLVAASIDPLTDLDALLEKLGNEAARSSDVLDLLTGMGRKGFVGVSTTDGEEDRNLSEVMRSYTGLVWRKMEFLHLP